MGPSGSVMNNIYMLVEGKDGQSLHSLRSIVLTRKVIFSSTKHLSNRRNSHDMCYELSFAHDLPPGHDMDEK